MHWFIKIVRCFLFLSYFTFVCSATISSDVVKTSQGLMLINKLGINSKLTTRINNKEVVEASILSFSTYLERTTVMIETDRVFVLRLRKKFNIIFNYLYCIICFFEPLLSCTFRYNSF